jgi:phenylacetic acid degradation operon negative regulatory protein
MGGETDDLAARATRPQALIITIYGAYSRPLGGWVSVAALLNLLGVVGVDEASGRGALSRLKRRGILVAERRDGSAGYALADGTRRSFDLGDARVLERRTPPPDRGWVLAAFSIPEASRDVRYRLRSRLARVGFSQVSGGLWIAPRQLEPDLRNVVASLGLEDLVDIFIAEHTGFTDTAQSVAQWWDLPAIGQSYSAFTREYGPLAASLARRKTAPEPQRAFEDYTRVLTAWRPIPYVDPGLSAHYLPKSWPGHRATEVFFTVHDALARNAMAYTREISQQR